jgi:hypothetical protein
MNARTKVLPAIGLVVLGAAASLVHMSLGAQTLQEVNADFTKAVLAEVRNAQNQVILSGNFVVSDEDDDDVERKAALAPTGIDADASGEAEVEVSGSGDKRRQEVEFSVTNVEPKGVFTFVIDGKVVATATADDRGRAEYERESPLPAAGTTR